MNAVKRGLAVIIILLVAGLVYWLVAMYIEPENGRLQASGTIEATTAEASARVYGTLAQVSVEEGDAVNKGQEIGRITRNDLVAQREQYAMALEKAKAQLNDLESGARSPEIEQAKANVEMARTSYTKSQSDLERIKALHDQGAISDEELENAQNAVALNQERLRAAESQLELLLQGNRPETIAAARAEVKRCQALVDAADAQLADLKIVAPLSGVVISKNYEAGEFVPAGASIATIADLNNLWIKVYIPTDDMPRVHLGQKVRVTVTGYDRVFSGEVMEIATKGEFTPRMIQTKKERTNVVFGVKIKVASGKGVLKPGMPADVEFVEGRS